MDIEFLPPEPPEAPERSRSWILYLLVLLITIGAIVARQVASIRARSAERTTSTSAPATSLMTGDLYVKYGLSHLLGANEKKQVAKAISSYKKALPWPAAYRRIGVAEQSVLKKSGEAYLSKLASAKATEGLSKDRIKKLKSEVVMWRDIYTSKTLSAAQADRYVSRIKDLNLGPLKNVAISDVYARSGRPVQAKAAMNKARSSAQHSIIGLGFLFSMLFVAGMLGAGLILYFLTTYNAELAAAGHPRISSRTLTLSFLAYLLGYYAFGIVLGLALGASGIDESTTRGVIIYLVINMIAMLGAWGLSLAVLHNLARSESEDPREIGSPMPVGKGIRWGVGGYCASLPLLFIASIASNTIFRNIPTPEHPIEYTILQGSLAFGLTFFMGTVLAPLVEETAFRGMLYTDLRTRLGVWPSALISAAIFAIVHPTLPGGFLPILALGTVFALLREKTGSLLPGMIAHGLNNGIQFIMLWLYT